MPNFAAIGTAAKKFACVLYRNQPGALIPNPVSDLLTQAWDAFCGDAPPPGVGGLPSPPSPGFSGGQCLVAYDVTVYVSVPGANPATNVIQVLGAIQGVGFVFKFPGDPDYFVGNGNIYEGYLYHANTRRRIIGGNVLNSQLDKSKFILRIMSVVRVDGQPDNCGDTPRFYPPPTTTMPPGGFTSPPTGITFNDGTTNNYYFNFTPPSLPGLFAKFIPPIIINYFNATLNPEFNIPISFNFDGSINFGDSGGGGNFNQDDRDTINDIDNVTNNLGDEITNIRNEINNITNNYNNKPPNPDDFEPPIENQPPGEYAQAYLHEVQIDLTKIPKNAKTQSGNGSPNVIYAGWFEWKSGGYELPREPIHFAQSSFIAPTGVSGFAFTLYNGFEGKATSVIYKEKI